MKYLNYIIVSLFIVMAVFPQDFGTPRGYVSDFAGVFAEGQEMPLELKMLEYEKRTSIEIVVVIVNDLQEMTLEDYARELFSDWGIGTFHNDTGILIFLSLDVFDKGLRIEVGHGLEEFLTDNQASRIINDAMLRLRNGDYSLALSETVELVIFTIGTRSEEAREEYLAGLKYESERQVTQLVTGLIVIGGVIIFFIIFFFIYKAIQKRKIKKQSEKQYKDVTIANLNSVHTLFDETYSGVEALMNDNFYGADDVLRKLNKQQKVITVELPDRLDSAKTHDDIVKIATDIDLIGDELHESASELFENHKISNVINNRLNDEIDNVKRQIEKSLPEMRQLITMINTENPVSIWRNFDYKNVDRNIENLFDKAEQSVRYAFKSLENYLYKEAKQHTTDATNHINDAFTYVQSVFDANQMINEGKNVYNNQMSRLPDVIKSVENSLKRSHVKSSTKDGMSDVIANYSALQEEVKKATQTDWIFAGALTSFVVSKCQEMTIRASKDIREYEYGEDRKNRAARRDKEIDDSNYVGHGSSKDDVDFSSFDGRIG